MSPPFQTFRNAEPKLVMGLGQPENNLPHHVYFLSSLSSLASAMRACWPASDTAFKNASTLFGICPYPKEWVGIQCAYRKSLLLVVALVVLVINPMRSRRVA